MIRFLTAGESHGKALIGLIEGVPAGIKIGVQDLILELKRRKRGYGRSKRQKIEDEQIEIVSGVRNGETIGSPIALYLANKDHKNWDEVMSVAAFTSLKHIAKKVVVPRPGHADLLGAIKYGHRDLRNVLERASARETAMRVALGTVAKVFLKELGVFVFSRVTSIGCIRDESSFIEDKALLQDKNRWEQEVVAPVEASPVRVWNNDIGRKIVDLIDLARKRGDTLGGSFEVYAFNLPLGLGSYVHWDRRLEGNLSKTLMALNGIKGVEIGVGSQLTTMWGSEVQDQIVMEEGILGFSTNRCGGITGGMSTGDLLWCKAFMKPIATCMHPLNSVNLEKREAELAYIERSDYCAVPSAAVISESLVALELMKSVQEKFGGDCMDEIKERWFLWKKNIVQF